MEFKKTYQIKKRKRIEDMNEQEIQEYTHYITKKSKTVLTPKNSLVEGQEAISQNPRYKEVKGANNEFLTRCLMDRSAITKE